MAVFDLPDDEMELRKCDLSEWRWMRRHPTGYPMELSARSTCGRVEARWKCQRTASMNTNASEDLETSFEFLWRLRSYTGDAGAATGTASVLPGPNLGS